MLIEFLVAFVIAAVCVTLHITVLLRLVQAALTRKEYLDQKTGFRHVVPILIMFFGVMLLLHVFEACIWGGFYWCYGLFPDWESSIYFSLGSYTTIGYGDLLLPRTWRLLGAIEGISGVLLCGVSAAMFFAIINAIFRMRMEQLEKREGSAK